MLFVGDDNSRCEALLLLIVIVIVCYCYLVVIIVLKNDSIESG